MPKNKSEIENQKPGERKLAGFFIYWGVVQLMERRSLEPNVAGLSPATPAIKEIIMMRKNRYRIIPRERKEKPRRSQPLKRSVHIDGKRWGWEYSYLYDRDDAKYGLRQNQRVKILAPDNRFFNVDAHEIMECKPVTHKYHDGSEAVIVLPGAVKRYILNNLLIGA